MGRPRGITISGMLVIGILAVSCGSLFVRLASPAPALAIAAYRMVWASILLSPFLVAGAAKEIRRARRGDWARLVFSGTALAVHFALWIASLGYTSVASSVLLVDTTPFFVGIAMTLRGERSTRSFWIGLAVAFLGCLLVFHGDFSVSAIAGKGNFLALGGAVAMAVYLLVGAQARHRLSLFAYVWPVYATSAVLLWSACMLAGVPLRGFRPSVYFFVFLLGVVPQCIGHTAYNWSLRWLTPGVVSLVALAEPVGASLLAWLFLQEHLSYTKAVGGGAILLGIYIATRKEAVSEAVESS